MGDDAGGEPYLTASHRDTDDHSRGDDDLVAVQLDDSRLYDATDGDPPDDSTDEEATGETSASGTAPSTVETSPAAPTGRAAGSTTRDHQLSGTADVVDEPSQPAAEGDSRTGDEVPAAIAHLEIETDPWDAAGWGLYPLRYRLKAEYGNQLLISDRVAPIRTFDQPDRMVDRWETAAQRCDVPVNTAVWERAPPDSTALSTRAFAIAGARDAGYAATYLRRLRIATMVEGRNIEDRDLLRDLAVDIGLDAEWIDDRWDHVTPPDRPEERIDPPTVTLELQGHTITQNSRFVHLGDLRMLLERGGLEAEPLPSPTAFITDCGPVTTPEVAHATASDPDSIRQQVRDIDTIRSVSYGAVEFWIGADTDTTTEHLTARNAVDSHLV